MPDTTDLIRRARELAKLRENATPGPWELVRTNAYQEIRMQYTPGKTWYGIHVKRVEDAELVVVAPDMAELLAELADALEAAERRGFSAGVEEALRRRGIHHEEDACPKCHGMGIRAYGSTATWRGGAGGAMVTSDVCDACWGSGNKSKPWANLRALERREPKPECPSCGTQRIIKCQNCGRIDGIPYPEVRR